MKKKDLEKTQNVQEMEDWSEKKGKKWIPFIIVLAIIVVFIIGYYVYFYVYKNTERYLDKLNNNINSSINEVFDELDDLQDESLANLDVQSKGSLNIKYGQQNLYDLEYDLKNSNKNLLTSLDLTLKQNKKRILGGNIFLQDNRAYIKSEEIYNKLLEFDMSTNLLTEENNTLDMSYMLFSEPEDLEYLLTKLVDYHITALKEGTLNTKPNGYNQKQYIIKLNATEKIDANKKLEELINDDDKLSNIIKKYNIENYNYLTTGELVLNVNVFTNDLKSFTVSTDDYDLTGEYDGEKYKITDKDNNYIYLWINDDKIVAEAYEDDALTDSISIITNEAELSIKCTIDGDTLALTLEEVEEDKAKMILTLNSPTNNMDINIVVNIENKDDKEINIEGTGNINVEKEVVEINFNMNSLYGDNLVERLDISKSKNINDLTEDEQYKILENIYDLIDKFGLTNVDSNLAF